MIQAIAFVSRGGGTRGRAVAFRPSKPGSYPGTNVAFSVQKGSILAGYQAFSKEQLIG